MANPNIIPKSLHTVTVLVTMARMILESGTVVKNADAVYKALDMLGYAPEKDCYGLAEQAIKKLNRI